MYMSAPCAQYQISQNVNLWYFLLLKNCPLFPTCVARPKIQFCFQFCRTKYDNMEAILCLNKDAPSTDDKYSTKSDWLIVFSIWFLF
jgi:hypothetical protein